MGTSTKLAVWLDHSVAYLIEVKPNPLPIITIESKYNTSPDLPTVKKQTLNQYYTKITNEIKHYKKIILFGPTDAKLELFDVLSEDERFLKMKVLIKETSQMNHQQQDEFVNKYFA